MSTAMTLHGPIVLCDQAPQNAELLGKRGRPSRGHLLNLGQALALVALRGEQ